MLGVAHETPLMTPDFTRCACGKLRWVRHRQRAPMSDDLWQHTEVFCAGIGPPNTTVTSGLAR